MRHHLPLQPCAAKTVSVKALCSMSRTTLQNRRAMLPSMRARIYSFSRENVSSNSQGAPKNGSRHALSHLSRHAVSAARSSAGKPALLNRCSKKKETDENSSRLIRIDAAKQALRPYAGFLSTSSRASFAAANLGAVTLSAIAAFISRDWAPCRSRMSSSSLTIRGSICRSNQAFSRSF